jgi:DNA-binding CsgD family transcriptional regulator
MARRGTPAGTDALLGRDDDLAVVAAAIDADAAIVIVGEAGVGKTTLSRTAIARSGRRWREGGGFGMLAWSPYLALERALGRRLVGGDTAYVAGEVAGAVGDGVLFVDDLQWVDPASRAAIARIVGRIAIVVAVRRGDPTTDAALAALPRSVRRHDLEPLDEAAATELVRRVRPDLAPDLARRIARRAGGNPLLVTELSAGGDAAPSLEAAIRVRLGALDPAARDAFSLLALAGHPMAAADLGPGAGRIASAGLAVIEADGRLRVRHDLLADAAVVALDAEERRQLHRRLADLAGEPGEAAHHLAAAGDRALAHRRALEAAAGAASDGERVAHLALAADTAEGDEALALRLDAARALSSDMDADRALAILGPYLGDATPAVALEAARAHRIRYDLEAAQAAVDGGLSGIEPGAPATIEAEVGLRIEAARIAVRGLADGPGSVALARRANDLAAAHGIAVAAARSTLGAARYLADDLGGLDDLEAAMDLALGEGSVALGIGIGSTLIFDLLKAGRPADGRALAEHLRPLARDARLRSWERQMTGWIAGCSWHAGDFATATAVVGESPPDDVVADDLVDWYRIQVLADLGRFEEARIRAERMLPGAIAGEYELGEALWLLADIACLAGRWAEAVDHADRHAREIPVSQHRIFVDLAGAWATFELGRPPRPTTPASVLPMAEGGPLELEAVRAMADARDLAARDGGRSAARPVVGSVFRAAADGFDAAAAAWHGRHERGALRSRWAAAECLRLAGETSAARERLLGLEVDLAAIGHAPFLARTRRSLRALGERRSVGRVAVAGSPLTAREFEILSLSGRGLRDAEIATQLGISRWAVIRAAESAGAKLGATTRLAAVAAITAMPHGASAAGTPDPSRSVTRSRPG